MLLTKVISGCQTGADQGGLFAAEALGLQTGGYMPKNYRTDDGPRVDLFYRFNLRLTSDSSYFTRTQFNVVESDGTLIVGNPESPGCVLTRKYALSYEKPLYVYHWTNKKPVRLEPEFLAWLKTHKIVVLNVAGNREAKNPGVFEATKLFLTQSVTELRKEEEK